MWATAEPVVREWIERHLGPAGRLEDAAQGAGEVGRFLGGVPGLLTRAATLADQLDAATRDGLVLAPRNRRRDRPGRGAAQPLDRRRRCG